MSTKKTKKKSNAGVYALLGKPYLKAINKAVPPQIYDFIKLIPKHGRVLDAGSAGGRDSRIFSRAGLRVVGIDVVDNFLRESRRYAPKARFIKMDIKNLSFPSRYFDAVWANAILLHIKRAEVRRVIKGFGDVLKPNGLLHVGVKRGRGEKVVKEALSAGEGRFFTYFSKSEIEKFIKAAGFKIIRSEAVPDMLGRKKTEWVMVWGQKHAGKG